MGEATSTYTYFQDDTLTKVPLLPQAFVGTAGFPGLSGDPGGPQERPPGTACLLGESAHSRHEKLLRTPLRQWPGGLAAA